MNELVSALDTRTIVSILSLITAIVFGLLAHKRHQRKSLSYEVISFVALFSVRPEWKDRVKILFDDKPVSSTHLVVIKLMNTGNTTITTTDYEEAIYFEFGDRAGILTAEVAGSNPEELSPTLTISERAVTLDKALMNSHDWVTVKILVCQPEPIKVRGRIAGVKSINVLPSEQERVERSILPVLSVLVLWPLFVGASLLTESLFKIKIGNRFSIPIALLLALICAISVRINFKAFKIAKYIFR